MKFRTYCLGCREHTNNIGSKRVTMINKWSETNQAVNVCLINQDLWHKKTVKAVKRKKANKNVIKNSGH